jgi:hypothetical protein
LEIRRRRRFFSATAIFDNINMCLPRARPNYRSRRLGGAIFGDFRRFVLGPAIQIFVWRPGIVE